MDRPHKENIACNECLEHFFVNTRVPDHHRDPVRRLSEGEEGAGPTNPIDLTGEGGEDHPSGKRPREGEDGGVREGVKLVRVEPPTTRSVSSRLVSMDKELRVITGRLSEVCDRLADIERVLEVPGGGEKGDCYIGRGAKIAYWLNSTLKEKGIVE